MATNNRICKVDLKPYSYCPSCERDRNKPLWYSMFCCERCKTVFETLVNNTLKKTSDDETRKILSSLDLSDIDKFEPDIKNQINNLLKESKTKEVQTEKTKGYKDKNKNSEVN